MSMKIHVGTASALIPLEGRLSQRREGGQAVAGIGIAGSGS